MARKRLSAEQIVTKLRQIEVPQAQGKTIAAACKEAGTTEQSSEMNVSMAKSSSASRRPEWSLKNGASITAQCARTHRTVTGRQPHLPSRQNLAPDESSNIR